MPISKDELFAKYEQLADRLEQHFRNINHTETRRRIVRLTREQFQAVCERADSNPVLRDWLYCIEHGYPGTRSDRRHAA